MTIVSTIDQIAAWLAERVCSQVKLKPKSIDQMDETFEYDLITPAVFPLYVPTVTLKPPHIKATSPAICVQLVKGSDDVPRHRGTLALRLSFSAWDPGVHVQDRYTPTGNGAGLDRVYERGEDGEFAPNAQGWRDVWNFVDTARRVIETDRTLGGYPLDPKTPIEFGVYEDANVVSELYPFWFAWMELTIITEIIVADPAIDDLL